MSINTLLGQTIPQTKERKTSLIRTVFATMSAFAAYPDLKFSMLSIFDHSRPDTSE